MKIDIERLNRSAKKLCDAQVDKDEHNVRVMYSLTPGKNGHPYEHQVNFGITEYLQRCQREGGDVTELIERDMISYLGARSGGKV
jgi:hypothetical protein